MIIYIHSDDMAATRQVTERMLESWSSGSIDGFSVIANGAAADFFASELQKASGRRARIAVHLNLSEGPSSAPGERVPLLVDQQGNLKHTFGTLTRLWLFSSGDVKRQLREQVTAEWRAQIARVQQLVAPRRVDVVDSHMHIHMLPFLFDISARLAKEPKCPQFVFPASRFIRAEEFETGSAPSTGSIDQESGIARLRAAGRTGSAAARSDVSGSNGRRPLYRTDDCGSGSCRRCRRAKAGRQVCRGLVSRWPRRHSRV